MRRFTRAAALALALLLSAAGLAERWTADREIHCREHRMGCRVLQAVMMGSFEPIDREDLVSLRVLSAALDMVREVTEEDLAHFASEFGEDAAAVRERWYAALANCLWADILLEEGRRGPEREVLLLFMDPQAQPDGMAQAEEIRERMTDEVLRRIAQSEDLTEDFTRWLIYR